MISRRNKITRQVGFTVSKEIKLVWGGHVSNTWVGLLVEFTVMVKVG